MQWREIIVHTTTDGADLLSELMMELGASGTEIVDRADVPDPDKPGVYWELYDKKLLEEMPEDVLVKGWFARDEQEQQTVENLKARLEALKTDSFGVEMGTLRVAPWQCVLTSQSMSPSPSPSSASAGRITPSTTSALAPLSMRQSSSPRTSVTPLHTGGKGDLSKNIPS